jgi:hypothetical protein
MAREMDRIAEKQLTARDNNLEYPLSAVELEAVLAAAKVASLLEKVKGDEAEPEEKTPPATKDTPEERLRRLEEKTPARVGRGAPDAEHEE